MKRVSLNFEEVLFLRGILRHGFVRDLHPNYRLHANPSTIAFYDGEVVKADALLARLDKVIESMLPAKPAA